ncbi:general odorant-binding protein 45-like [Culex quinquefasciatus]|uniref:general odorant-binding protein 45-like n=1 Tax=Culex quinquefasciatus TaxID=7176 RepID=UPI0018E31F5A|nr:general odorant-binding protein 45-like [Culex quinquefasciatus]
MANLFLTLLVTTAVAVIVTGSQHSASFKSIRSADRECSQFSGDQSCTARCRGLVTRFWNDTTGLPDATITRFFAPRGCSYCRGESSTEQCLGDVNVRIRDGDRCARAEQAVKCYDQRCRDSEQKFIPFTDFEQLETLQKCVDILQLSPGIVKELSCNGMLSRPEGRCLLRCFMIRSGLYSDAEGPILDRVNVQCVSGYGQTSNLQNVDSCVAKLRSECGIDKCSLASRAVVECLQVKLEIIPPVVDFVPYGVDFLFIPSFSKLINFNG